MTEKTLGLYVHFPFCINKCPYCDFYSSTNKEDLGRYVSAAILQMEDYSKAASKHDIDTVFFGGGTPTAVPIKQLLRVIDGIYDNFNVRNDAEFTIEANPATVKTSTLRKLRRAGVNRVSLGLQSAVDSELKALGRIHTFEDFVKSFKMVRKAGIDNVSVDLMYGIPTQTPESFAYTLEQVTALDPDHISIYSLKIEEGTPFHEMKDSLELPDEDSECKMYFDAVEYLASKGYEQYEISNFAKAGKQCVHNLRYWNCEEYIGFGPGAHSYFSDRRFAFKRSTADYIKSLEFPGSVSDILSENYEVKPSERIGEYVMLRMRLSEGVDTEFFAATFGLDFERIFGKYLQLYSKNGFMEKRGRCWCFTPKGMFVSSYILSSMLDFDSDILKGIAEGTDR